MRPFVFAAALVLCRGLAGQNSPLEVYDQVYPYFLERSAAPQANEDATYAWGVSYALLADVEVYRATGDPRYLDRALGKMARVIANRDDRRGVADYRGRSLAAWRDVHYQLPAGKTYHFGDPDNRRYAYCWVVHSGMITYPMALLAELIRDNGEEGAFQGRNYEDWADYLVARVKETVAAHDGEWVDSGGDEGYYRFPDFPEWFRSYPSRNRDAPFNQSNAMGSTLLVLYRLTGDDQYFHKAFRLARRFKRSLAPAASDAYSWMYWQKPGVREVTGAGEDISHASINLTFARQAFETGIVFEVSDMRRFARTFTEIVARGTTRAVDDGCGRAFDVPDVADAVGGGTKMNRHWMAAGRWLEMSEFDPQLYGIAARIFDWYRASILCRRALTNGESGLLGFAELVWMEPQAAAERDWWLVTGDW